MEKELPPHERYQYKPFIGSSHSWALKRCYNMPNSSSLLDIGAGSGAMGQALKDHGWRDLCCVEVDDQARNFVSNIYTQREASIDPFRHRQFDLILLLDVLEHMNNPFDFLSEVSSLAKPNATILISVPNITHWSIRLSLLCGFFEYSERGILDKTHLQFFSRRRFRKMVSSVPNLIPIELGASIVPLELILPKPLWDNAAFQNISRLRSNTAQLLPSLLGFQHLACLRKSAN